MLYLTLYCKSMIRRYFFQIMAVFNFVIIIIIIIKAIKLHELHLKYTSTVKETMQQCCNSSVTGGGTVSDFPEKSITTMYGSTLLVLRGCGWGWNFQKKHLRRRPCADLGVKLQFDRVAGRDALKLRLVESLLRSRRTPSS